MCDTKTCFTPCVTAWVHFFFFFFPFQVCPFTLSSCKQPHHNATAAISGDDSQHFLFFPPLQPPLLFHLVITIIVVLKQVVSLRFKTYVNTMKLDLVRQWKTVQNNQHTLATNFEMEALQRRLHLQARVFESMLCRCQRRRKWQQREKKSIEDFGLQVSIYVAWDFFYRSGCGSEISLFSQISTPKLGGRSCEARPGPVPILTEKIWIDPVRVKFFQTVKVELGVKNEIINTHPVKNIPIYNTLKFETIR